MARYGRFAVALLTVGTEGCSLVVSLPSVPSDATIADASDSPSPDAGSAVDSEPDGTQSADGAGSKDAGSSVPYPQGSWCAIHAPALFLCDDFDFGALGSRWTNSNFKVTGAAFLSTATFLSAPNGFEIDYPPTAANTFELETLSKQIPATSRVTVAFDFDPLSYPRDARGGALYLATLEQGPGVPRSSLAFRAGPSLTDLQEMIILPDGTVEPFTQTGSSTIVPQATWTRVEITIDFAVMPATATLRLNGQLVVTHAMNAAWTEEPGTVDLGDWYIPTEPAFQVVYDNVTIATQ